MAFTVPESYEARETRFWVDESGQNGEVLEIFVGIQILTTAKDMRI